MRLPVLCHRQYDDAIVLDDLDYLEIAADLDISSSDIAIADEIEPSDIISEITDHLDMDKIYEARF